MVQLFFLMSYHVRFLQVYDVSEFLEEHPGGDEVILSATGLLYASFQMGLYSMYPRFICVES